jgi:predicted nucleic acid-binding protein
MGKSNVYVDTNILIDYVKLQQSEFSYLIDEQNSIFIKGIIAACQDTNIIGYTSMLTMVECLYIRDEQNTHQKTDDIKNLFDDILLSVKGGIITVEPTMQIIKKARDLYWDDKVNIRKPIDLIHLSTALHFRCQEFYTFDQKDFNKCEYLEEQGLRIVTKYEEADIIPKTYFNHQYTLL